MRSAALALAALALAALAAWGLAGSCARPSKSGQAESAPPPAASAAVPAVSLAQAASEALPDARARRPSAAQAVPTSDATRPRAAARVGKVSGAVRVGDRAAAPVKGELLVAGALLFVPAGAGLAFDLENGARVELESESMALLPVHDPGTVVLVRGAAHVLAAGQAANLRMPLRLASDALSVQSASPMLEAWLSVPGPGVSLLAVFAGGAMLEHVLPAYSTSQLTAGQLLRVVGSRERIERGPRDLVAARALTPARSAAPRPALDAALLRAFDGLSGTWRGERAAEDAAVAEQRAAHARADHARVHALQSEIVARAARVIALRRALRALYERRLAVVGAKEAGPDVLAHLASDYAAVAAPLR